MGNWAKIFKAFRELHVDLLLQNTIEVGIGDVQGVDLLLKCDLCHMTCDSMSPSLLCFLLLSFSLTHSLVPSMIT